MASNNPKNTSEAFTSAAEGDITTKFHKDIVDYAKADKEIKKKMDALIASIDTKDLTTITAFAKEPTEALRDSSEEIVKKAQDATTFLGTFGQIKAKLENFDFSTIGEKAAEYVKEIDRKLSLATLTWRHPIKKIKGLFGGGDTTMDDIRHEVDKSLLQLSDVVADLENAKEKIPEVITDLNTLKAARLDAYSEYSVYLGAALEKYRRVKEELPQLEKEATDSPLKAQELSDARLAMTVLNAKVTDMDTFHKSCLVQLDTLDDLKEALAMSQVKIDSHLTISEGQWMALLAEASTAVQIGEIAQSVHEADIFGDRIFEQSQKLSDMTKAMSRAAFERGTLDPVKVVEHLKERTAGIQEDLVYMTEFNQKMEAQRAQLDEAGRLFREAAAKVTSTTIPAVANDDAPATKQRAKKDSGPKAA